MDGWMIIVALIGSALMAWGLISLIFFMIDDLWPFGAHSISWLPGGWNERSSTVVATGRPITHG